MTMKLALVSPLPPLGSPAAGLVVDLLPHLGDHAELRLLPHAPEQADRERFDSTPIDPCADLPHLLATGAVDLPVYFVADDLLHAHQVRFVREFPGLLVLLTPGVHRILAALTEESGDLDAYRELLVEEHGETARGWPERFLWRSDRERLRDRLPLAGVLCRRSLGVLAPSGVAGLLRGRCADVPIDDLPSFDDPSAIAAKILEIARRVIARPRAVTELPQPSWPSVDVVIVSYNSRRIIAPALRSIVDQDYPNLTCTVVDSASTDGTAQHVRDEFPEVDVVASPTNVGFSGGNNIAFARSKAKYVVLFNQDAVARRDFVRELVRVAERDDNVGAVGAKMLMMRCPTILNSTGVIMNEGGFAVDRCIGDKDVDPSPVPDRVFAACGGAKLVRTDLLQKLGGFDPSFFMYCEDVDLCWRLRLAGKEILYAPLAVVYHDWHGDLDGDAEPQSKDEIDARTRRRRMLCERNRMQCVIKNYSFGTMLRTLLRLRRYDKIRYRHLDHAIANGIDVAAARLARGAIKEANRWCVLHFFSILRRRFRSRACRRVSDEDVTAYIDPGVGEPHHVGDLFIVNDRHSAQSTARLQMGLNDHRALGSGWHPLEQVPGEESGARWCKRRAWLYIDAETPSRKLMLRLGRGAIEPNLHVKVGAQDLGRHSVEHGDLHVIEIDLPIAQDPAKAIEIELRCDAFRPSDIADSDDRRELGVRVAEVWLESGF